MSENSPGGRGLIRSMVDGEDHQRWIHVGDLIADLRTQPDPTGALGLYADGVERYALQLDLDVNHDELG